jgi:hypothetical protein
MMCTRLLYGLHCFGAIFCLLVVEPQLGVATTIVVIRTPSGVVFAADSKPTYRGRQGAETVCKIYKSGRLYFAIAGIEHDTSREFFPAELIANVFSSPGSFNKHLLTSTQMIKEALKKELQRLHREDPDTYRYTIKDGGDVLSIAFAGIENGVPILAVRGFQEIVKNEEIEIKIQEDSCPGKCNGVKIFYLGKHDAIERFIKANTGWSGKPEVLAEKLVNLEIEEYPNNVGPPIDVMAISPHEARWIHKKDTCPLVATP